jgi:lipoprotein-anchoring transpeptidase ErfK/SrfK
VEVDLTKQQLSAWEGNRLVLQTHISSGRYRNSTPMGEFTAGPYKSEMHFSKKYNNAPMPWSVQLNDHVFIHGFSSVPRYPASHGCIRVPLDKGNPAKFFYEWVEVGTVVRVVRS